MKKNEKKAASKLPKVDPKLEAKVKTAQSELEAYLKKNKLDPAKDWTKDKKHGAKIKELVAIVNVARKKLEDSAPKEIHHKKSEDKKKEKPAKSSTGARTIYDYPKVGNREMTSDENKKYRQKMRKEKAAGAKASDTKTSKKEKTPEPTRTEKVTKVIGKDKKKKKKVKSSKRED